MNRTDPKRTAARAVIFLSTVTLLSSGVTFAGRSIDTYNEGDSMANMLAIGRSLQIYRSQHCKLPADKWKDAEDAGLPNSLLALAEPGHPWSLPNGVEHFRIKGTATPNQNGDSDYFHPYVTRSSIVDSPYFKPGPQEFAQLAEVTEALQRQKEKFVVMFDPNPGANDGASPTRRVLVLRLDGTVEAIQIGSGKNAYWR